VEDQDFVGLGREERPDLLRPAQDLVDEALVALIALEVEQTLGPEHEQAPKGGTLRPQHHVEPFHVVEARGFVYSAEAKAEQREARAAIQSLRKLLEAM
jgi:hypothetical protein